MSGKLPAAPSTPPEVAGEPPVPGDPMVDPAEVERLFREHKEWLLALPEAFPVTIEAVPARQVAKP